MYTFQKDLEKFEKLNTQVIGVSSDSLETHGKFSAKYNLTFPLISDEDNGLKRLYSPGRITYLIDKQGIVRLIRRGIPENKEFLNKLEEIEHIKD